MSDEDWKKKLNEEEYKVLRLCGTERPFTGKYYSFFEPGIYACTGCGQPMDGQNTAAFRCPLRQMPRPHRAKGRPGTRHPEGCIQRRR